ncbi:MAG: di-heme oxidoredictase family protein [Myxococcaceae bacterium]
MALALALALSLCACGQKLVLPAPPAGTDDVTAMGATFSRADELTERKMRELLTPGATARLRAEQLDRADVATWLDEGRLLFVTDTPWHGERVEVRPLHGATPSADSTRCVACHFTGGLGGAGAFSERTFVGGDGDDATTARVRAPRMLAGAALLELLAAEDPQRVPFGWERGARTLREAVEHGARWHLGAEPTDAELDALTLAVAAVPLPLEDTLEADSLRQRLANGRGFFVKWGCAACHVEALPLSHFTLRLSHGRTLDVEASTRAQLGIPTAAVRVPLFSDLKPHDVGTGTTADPGPFVTPPLWGVGTRLTFLHDGRVTTLDDAISAHAGEAAKAAAAWREAQLERRDLTLFLLTLTRPTRLEGSP